MNISKVPFKSFFFAGGVLFLFSQPLLASGRYVTCNSHHHNYNYCRVDTDNVVRLTQKLSSAHCTEGETWGYDDHGIWVDRGCSAEFAVGRSGYNDYNQDNFGGVPAWAVGNFRGKNERDHTGAAITISRSGDVVATWAGRDHKGYFERNNMRLGDLDFIVKQRGDGFETILRSDHGNRVHFHRVR